MYAQAKGQAAKEPAKVNVLEEAPAFAPSASRGAPPTRNPGGKGKGEGKGRKPEAREDPPASFKAKITCKFCHKSGHYEDRCFAKAKAERKARKATAEAQQTPPVRNDSEKKRKLESISFQGELRTSTVYLDTRIGGRNVSCVVDTGATTSAISSRFAHGLRIEREKSVPVRMGNGTTVYSQFKGAAHASVLVGNSTVDLQMLVLDTTAFEQ